MKTYNVVTLFSGYDSQCLALNRLGVPYELVGWSEIDRYAIRAHNALFPQWENRNLGDVTLVDWDQFRTMIAEPIDLLTYSSPCQDFSTAGLGRGGEEGSGTRSGLLWESQRAIEALHPRWLLFENVPNLLSKKHRHVFAAWCERLESLGYSNYWSTLNAKHYGVPQNRNRVFMVSVFGGGEPYSFPEPFKLERRLKDVLEKEVAEKYYLSEERVKGLLLSTWKEKEAGRGFKFAPKTEDDICAGSVTTNAGGRKTDNFIADRESAMLSQRRTEEMKEDRRHHKGDRGLGWGKKELAPREDGLSNTITSAEAKDNLLLEQILLNGDKEGNASTITTGHDRARNITEPKGGHKQMGVMEIRTRHIDKTVGDEDNSGATPTVCEHILLNGGSDGTAATLTSEGARRGYDGILKPCGGRSVMGVMEIRARHIGDEIVDDIYPGRPPRHYGECSPTVRSGHDTLKVQEVRIAAVRGRSDGDWHETEHQQRLEISKEETSNTLSSVAKDNLLCIRNGTKAGYIEVPDGAVFDGAYPTSETRRGRVQEGGSVSPTVMSESNTLMLNQTMRIRRLTERELFRLMDVDDKDIDTILSAGIPKTQLAKMAGNSIVVNVLYHILNKLLVDTEAEEHVQLTLF